MNRLLLRPAMVAAAARRALAMNTRRVTAASSVSLCSPSSSLTSSLSLSAHANASSRRTFSAGGGGGVTTADVEAEQQKWANAIIDIGKAAEADARATAERCSSFAII